MARRFASVDYFPWTVSRAPHSFAGVESRIYESARETLAACIKRRRAELGLTQEGLALDADIDRTFVSQIERGVGNPSLRILCRIAERLDLPAMALLDPDFLWAEATAGSAPKAE